MPERLPDQRERIEALAAHADRAYLLALRICGSAAQAEEAVQEAYARLLLKPPPRDLGPEAALAYFLQATRYTAMDLSKSARRRKRREESHAMGEFRSAEAPDNSALRSEAAQAARAALSVLPVDEREAVSLCCEMDLSRKAASEILGVPERTLSARVNRGLEKLRARLEAQGYAALTPLAIGEGLRSLGVPPAPQGVTQSMGEIAASAARGSLRLARQMAQRGPSQLAVRSVAVAVLLGAAAGGYFTLSTAGNRVAPAPLPDEPMAAGMGEANRGPTGIRFIQTDGSLVEARAVNDAGAVAGFATDAESKLRAVVQTGEEKRVLDILAGSTGTGQGFAINKNGVVAGMSQSADARFTAVLWSDGKIASLGYLPGGRFSYAHGINDAGDVVGFGTTSAAGFTNRAFIWKSGKMTDLPTLGGRQSVAQAINNRSVVVGYAEDATGLSRPAMWTGGKAEALSELPGIAYAINDAGQIVGQCKGLEAKRPEGYEAVLWRGGAMVRLGTLGGANSQALGINEAGEIVGAAESADGKTHAFLWREGRMIDLNALAPAESNCVLEKAHDINNRGQIAGTCTQEGRSCGYLLTVEAP